jgi:hypothetical protein
MNIVVSSKSGPDSKLHLEVPVNEPNAEFVVELVVRPKVTERILPAGYFDLLGSVQDETLQVHPQPSIPPAVTLE